MVRAARVIGGLRIDEGAMWRNLQRYGPFAAMERLLTALVARGAERQEAHEWLRQISLEAWQSIGEGAEIPLLSVITADEQIRTYLSAEQIAALMDVSAHTGTATERAVLFARLIREAAF